MSPRRARLLALVLGLTVVAAAVLAWPAGEGVAGTPFYTCEHSCTRYLATASCRAGPPGLDYIAADGCGLGSGLVVWVDREASVPMVIGDADIEAQPRTFDYRVASPEDLRQVRADRTGRFLRVSLP